MVLSFECCHKEHLSQDIVCVLLWRKKSFASVSGEVKDMLPLRTVNHILDFMVVGMEMLMR